MTWEVFNGKVASKEAYDCMGAETDSTSGEWELCTMPSVACCRPGRLSGRSSAADTGGGLSESVSGVDESFDEVPLPLSGVGWSICDRPFDDLFKLC